MNKLPELRDIKLPDGVSIFPPAYGWWIILAVVILIIIFSHFRKKAKLRDKKHFALSLINQIDDTNIVFAAIEMSHILRRICVYKYPHAKSLFGKKWIDFLNEKSNIKTSDNVAELLTNAPFMNTENHKFQKQDADDLIAFCKNWIGENL